MHGATVKTVNAQEAKLNNHKNIKLKLLKGGFLNVLMWNFI